MILGDRRGRLVRAAHLDCIDRLTALSELRLVVGLDVIRPWRGTRDHVVALAGDGQGQARRGVSFGVVRHPFPPVQHPPLTKIHECWPRCPLRLHNPTASNKARRNLNYKQHRLFLQTQSHHKKHNNKPLLFPPNILLRLPCTFENGLLPFLDLKNRAM